MSGRRGTPLIRFLEMAPLIIEIERVSTGSGIVRREQSAFDNGECDAGRRLQSFVAR